MARDMKGGVSDLVIIQAAMAWARAERALRNRMNFAPLGEEAQHEERHRILITSDWTEEELLRLCEKRGL